MKYHSSLSVKFSLPTDFSMEAVRPLKTVCDKIGCWISAELIMHKVYPLGQSSFSFSVKFSLLTYFSIEAVGIQKCLN